MKDLFAKLEIELAIKHERSMLAEFKEMTKLIAEKQKIYFDELVIAGFDEDQALAIVRDHGIDVGKTSWIIPQDKREEEEGE